MIGWIRKNKILLSIIVLSFLIRIYGIGLGYPHNINIIWDETNGMTYLLDIIQTRDFIGTSSQYPVLLPLLYFPLLALRLLFLAVKEGFYSVVDLKNYLIEFGIGNIYIIIRWYGVFFGTATVYFIYKIYRIIFENKFSAYAAALTYSLSIVPVAMSHWGKTHNALVFFLVLSLYYILKFEKTKFLKYYYWSLVFSVLSFCSHYMGVSAFIFPFLGIIFNLDKFNFKKIIKSIFISLPLIAIFYGATWKGVVSMINNQLDNYYSKTGFSGLFEVGKFERFYYVFRDSFYIEPVFIFLFILLLLFNLKKYLKSKYERYVIIGIFFNYLLMITVIVGPGLSRWLLTFLVLSAPFAAGVVANYLWKKINHKYAVVAVILLLLPSFIFSLSWLKIVKNHTLIETSEWLQLNMNKKQAVYSFNYELMAPLSYEAALYSRNINNVYDSDKVNYILEHKDKFENAGINLFYDNAHNRYEELGGEKTEFLAIYYWFSGESEERTMLTTKKSAYETLDKIREFHNIELVKIFYPSENKDLIKNGIDDYINNPRHWKTLLMLEKSGPFVEIYRVLN
jgi:hypothetical protein